MKIQIISDIHQEFGFNQFRFDNADIVVFAGDINLGVKGISWMVKEISNKPVIYVLGNHEYYKGSYPKTLLKIKEAAKGTNIHVLENESIEIDGITFHGATLWTDFSIFGNPIKYGIICQEKMNDYKKIRRDPSYSRLRTIDTFNLHNQSISWLKNSLIESNTVTNIVVTHHAPSIKSVPNQYKEDPVSSAYASNLEDFIIEQKPQYWLHGHVHTPVRYKINETEVICNPHGYIDEKYNGYEKELIIEVN
ncbi:MULTISPECIES: metallophosphoesterase [Carboxylicivirga]|uniref:Metallophosphoesterase n=1 Tax=Carboxylicivirga linearis TaxID=1628157 RepID=A0ABS5K2I2_9BACT|nr:metallophosphoesterase [Carboxylicivirga linearis]MBS2100721.1 metallophosphoesterase [Carboxylicivirga linearis]MCU4163857.1 metallophosphoesterase [Marinilabiliaceae bacterium A049]